MQIHRFEVDLLLNWLNNQNRKPLILRGARQVGKSSLVRYVATLSKRFCYELNLERNPELAEFFVSKKPATILNGLSLYFKREIDINTSILFLDEIQAAPKLIEVLRYFYEECQKLPIIAAGSLLDFVLAEPEFSVPVGRVEYFHLGPISFEDYLIAMKEEQALAWLKTFTLGNTIPLPIHEQYLELTKKFWLIGGMPEVLAKYASNNNLNEVNSIKENILQSYQEDFYKYGRIKQIPLLRQVFKTIPSLVGKKIKYVQLDKDSKALETKKAVNYLSLAKVINLVYSAHANGLPLGAELDSKNFKAIFLDIGLLNTVLGLDSLSILQAPEWAWVNRGSLAEQFVGQVLLQLYPYYKTPELFYWLREQPQANAEIDYLWQHNTQIIPIEVKAGSTGHLKSLHYFMQNKSWHFAVRFNADLPRISEEQIKLPNCQPFSYTLLSLPFYLVTQLPRLLAIYWDK